MNKLTKAQLAAANEALRNELNTLREQMAKLTQSHRAAYRQIEALEAEVEANNTPTQRVARHMPQWQAERAAAMHAAREMAMKTRMVVKA